MNKRLEELMIEAGYAAPELAGRANRLAELIVNECREQILAIDSDNADVTIGLMQAEVAVRNVFKK